MSKASDSLYLLLGPEQGEKDCFVKRLIERIGKERGEPAELHRHYCFDTDLGEVLAILRNGALFASYRITILNNIEELTRKREIELLGEYCRNPTPHTSLLLLSDEIGRVDKRIERMVPKENKVIFWELFENQKQGWITNYFQSRKIQIDSQAIGFLLDMVENNTRQLQETCEKLALFFGPGATIGYAGIEKLLFHSKDENVFTLFEKLSVRDFPSSLEVLNKILLSREADAVQLLAGLVGQYRKLMAAKRLLAQNYSPEEVWSRLEVRSKKVQKIYADASRRYSLGELQDIIRLTARFDLRVRSLKAALHPTLLELYLYYAVVNGGRGSWATSRVFG